MGAQAGACESAGGPEVAAAAAAVAAAAGAASGIAAAASELALCEPTSGSQRSSSDGAPATWDPVALFGFRGQGDLTAQITAGPTLRERFSREASRAASPGGLASPGAVNGTSRRRSSAGFMAAATPPPAAPATATPGLAISPETAALAAAAMAAAGASASAARVGEGMSSGETGGPPAASYPASSAAHGPQVPSPPPARSALVEGGDSNSSSSSSSSWVAVGAGGARDACGSGGVWGATTAKPPHSMRVQSPGPSWAARRSGEGLPVTGRISPRHASIPPARKLSPSPANRCNYPLCVHVCMCGRLCFVCVHACMHARVHVHVHVYVSACMYVCKLPAHACPCLQVTVPFAAMQLHISLCMFLACLFAAAWLSRRSMMILLRTQAHEPTCLC